MQLRRGRDILTIQSISLEIKQFYKKVRYKVYDKLHCDYILHKICIERVIFIHINWISCFY